MVASFVDVASQGCVFAGTTSGDFNEAAYALEFYAPCDWDVPEAYARLVRG